MRPIPILRRARFCALHCKDILSSLLADLPPDLTLPRSDYGRPGTKVADRVRFLLGELDGLLADLPDPSEPDPSPEDETDKKNSSPPPDGPISTVPLLPPPGHVPSSET